MNNKLKVGDQVMLFLDFDMRQIISPKTLIAFDINDTDSLINYIVGKVTSFVADKVCVEVDPDTIFPNEHIDFFSKYEKIHNIKYLNNNTIQLLPSFLVLKKDGEERLKEMTDKINSIKERISLKYDEIDKILEDINVLCKSENLPSPKEFSKTLEEKSLILVENLGWSTSYISLLI